MSMVFFCEWGKCLIRTDRSEHMAIILIPCCDIMHKCPQHNCPHIWTAPFHSILIILCYKCAFDYSIGKSDDQEQLKLAAVKP